MDKDTYFNELSSIFKRKINPTGKYFRNNCVGALGEEQYSIFSEIFFSRIVRLNKIFSHDQKIIDTIINCLKNIPQNSGVKWSGKYSELVALDFFSKLICECKCFYFPYNKDVNKAPNSIAKMIGQKKVDIDLCFQPYLDNVKKIFIDIKSFLPNHHEIIDGIIKDTLEIVNNKNILIGINNMEGGNFFENKNILSKNKKQIISKLIKAINNKEYNLSYKIDNNRSFNFNINHRGSLSTMDSFDPYEIAENNYHRVLTCYNKLLTKENSMLCFVINPWFNKDFNQFHDKNNSFTEYNVYEIFYRAFSRRVFCKLTKENNLMSTEFPDFKNTKIKYSDIAKKITGILFIEDNSISKKEKEIYNAYLYLNPNATNNKLNIYDFNFFNLVNDINIKMMDDFTHDNY